MASADLQVAVPRAVVLSDLLEAASVNPAKAAVSLLLVVKGAAFLKAADFLQDRAAHPWVQAAEVNGAEVLLAVVANGEVAEAVNGVEVNVAAGSGAAAAVKMKATAANQTQEQNVRV